MDDARVFMLARELAPQVNDATLWLGYENLQLANLLQEDASPHVSRRLGDLATDLFTMGIHRESTYLSKVPFFLAECRRRTFFATYRFDKYFSTTFDRPPRISMRWTDCRLPLDLADDELFADASELQQACLRLTPEGWNAEGQHTNVTWLRIRHIIGIFREEIYEYSFRPLTSEDKIKLNDPDSSPELLEISADILATILQLGSCLGRAVFLRRDFNHLVRNSGLPSAAVLATALHSNTTLPANLSRSTLIRNLSVFIAHLESIYSPEEANYGICMQAAKIISRTLDDVLEPPTPPSHTQATLATTQKPGPASQNPDSTDMTVFSASQHLSLGADGMSGPYNLAAINIDTLDALDLSDWVDGIDWSGTGGELNTL
ncbi:hypothetical protein H2203_006365 [Taxawa tesnikishii (nom. ined.)]|nr:hypothetical protein H2203_006365 [Dothideales sp. JES 119]